MGQFGVSYYSLRCIMLIGLLSDTHIPVDAKALPGQIKEVFRDVDLILHAGDIYIVSVLDELESIAPVLAAQGDDDASDVTSDRRVKEQHAISVDGVTISLMHREPGFGPWATFPESRVDPDPASPHGKEISGIVVFGDTHRTKVVNRGGFLLINPGSPTFPYYVHRPGTVALLTVSSGKAKVHIVQLE